MMKIVFVIGGIRSGKSSYACQQAKKIAGDKNVTYIGTGIAKDEWMKEKIKKHKILRPEKWQTIEEPLNLIFAFNRIQDKTKIVIIDCINFWLFNAMTKKWSKEKIIRDINIFFSLIKKIKFFPRDKLRVQHNKDLKVCYVISNEVGLSLIPATKIGQKFQDMLGEINKLIATRYADEVKLLVAGIPLKLK